MGLRLPVEWVDIADPDPNLEGGALSCFRQGRNLGGAAFSRLEGIFRGEDGRSIYFACACGLPDDFIENVSVRRRRALPFVTNWRIP